jgi:hypothetical protein
MIRSGFVNASAFAKATARRASCFGLLQQLRPLGGEADLGKAKEDDAKERAEVFLGFKAGVGSELVGGVPEALFQGFRQCVLFRWGNPEHTVPESYASPRITQFQSVSDGNQK